MLVTSSLPGYYDDLFQTNLYSFEVGLGFPLDKYKFASAMSVTTFAVGASLGPTIFPEMLLFTYVAENKPRFDKRQIDCHQPEGLYMVSVCICG